MNVANSFILSHSFTHPFTKHLLTTYHGKSSEVLISNLQYSGGPVLSIRRLRLTKIWITLSLLCSREDGNSHDPFKLTLSCNAFLVLPCFSASYPPFTASSDLPSGSLCREGLDLKFSPHSFLNSSDTGHLAFASTILPWHFRNCINMCGLPK